MELGNNIKKFRKTKGLTQKELANLIGLTASTITKYENNSLEPNMNTLQNIANALDTTVISLLSPPNGHFSFPKKLEDAIQNLKNMHESDNQLVNMLSITLISIINGTYQHASIEKDNELLELLLPLLSSIMSIIDNENLTPSECKECLKSLSAFSVFITKPFASIENTPN